MPGFAVAGLTVAGGAAVALEAVPPELELPTAEPVDDSDDAPRANATPVIIANAAAPASLCNGIWGEGKRSDRVGKYLATQIPSGSVPADPT